MSLLQHNVSLKAKNTFGIQATARLFAAPASEEELLQLHSKHNLGGAGVFVLGGGSNVLFTQDYNGLLVQPQMLGITFQKENENVFVTAGAGVPWVTLVNYCVQNNFAGAENLSLIPGTVGASPVQNIGAYGVELKDIFYTCRALDTLTGKIVQLSNAECEFAYRSSIFKTTAKGRYIITSVTFKLSTIPQLQLSYGAITQELHARGITHPTISNVANVVSAIRVFKLPDPTTIGNAGSFFKNPVITAAEFEKLQNKFPTIVNYLTTNGVKLAAGWLIEQCGFKGVKHGNTGTWQHQALVLVNYGGATGTEVLNFSQLIINAVRQKFGVTLQPEVNIL